MKFYGEMESVLDMVEMSCYDEVMESKLSIKRGGDRLKNRLEELRKERGIKQEELAAASKDYADRIAKEKEFDEQYQKNIEQTLKTLCHRSVAVPSITISMASRHGGRRDLH